MALKLSSSLMNEKVKKFTTKELATLNHTHTVKQAISLLREKQLCEKIIYFYAVDDNGVLLGVVPVRKLLSCDETEKVSDIMDTPIFSIRENATLLQASELFLEHRYMALPVVDDNNKLTGVIDINLFTDGINALSKKQELEKAFQFIGVHIAASRKVSAWIRFKDRFPWLICNMLSGLLCAVIVSRYQLMLKEVITLAIFMTAILALSESVSIQSMTITLQHIIHSKLSFSRLLRLLRRELTTALLLGASSGLVLFFISFVWKHNLVASVLIFTGVLLGICTAGIFGVIIPTVIYSLKADPKVATGPIVLALVDVVTLFLYFGIASHIL
ncbi:MAG: CBS domain-containing protein [bacterium]